ncbi:pyridoxamine 5'-phosphate oxidase family protein [Kineococcus terrestris]|uniref:pyridoxamine 5'-phosphate oxidase family protein n=1 Tax=Kineococcus terrestris TaxID=2044856 RepID=UPI0034DB2468
MTDSAALTPAQCRRLLGERGIGRAVYTEHALPAVATMNYAVVGERLWFRTAQGTALERAVDDAVIAFNADAVDAARRSGWSVTVSGRCRRVTGPEPEAVRTALDTWAPGVREVLFALDMAHVTGRRIGPVELASAS